MADKHITLTQEFLHELFEYRDGELYWKKTNQLAGNIRKHDGYRAIKVKGKLYKAHRLIFLMFNGFLPKHIDHKDCNRLNNNIENLRPATATQNNQNSVLRKDNTSGVKGVIWDKTTEKFGVKIRINGVRRSFGQFYDIDYAKFIADVMRHKFHGEFSRFK